MSRLVVHVVTLLAAGALALHPEVDEDMAELAGMVRESCVDETGVDTAVLAKIDNGADLFPDPKLMCYIKCTMETAGMMTDGVVDVEVVLVLLPPGISKRNTAAVRECGTQQGADDCEVAFRTQACWQTANKADYFFI